MQKTLTKNFTNFLKPKSQWKKPVRVAVTGANGNIGYASLFRIANGEMLGPDQPIILHLIDLPNFQQGLQGIKMELTDCAFPLLQEIVTTDDLSIGFKDIDCALLIGSKPRGPGMERADLLKDNGKIFVSTGKALDDYANRDCKIVVVGNPANTNCLIAQSHAPNLNPENFSAMTRLDHDRALSQLALNQNCSISDIQNFCIWGNHSPTMFPDSFNATINGTKFHNKLDHDWRVNKFIPEVQQRGGAIIKARGLSSAASAGNAAIAHMRDWMLGTAGNWTSMGVLSRGEYGIQEGLIYSFPVVVGEGVEIVKGVQVGEEQMEMMRVTESELLGERQLVEHLMK